MNKKQLPFLFYKNLTTLFYAFSAIDGHIRDEEYLRILNEVKALKIERFIENACSEKIIETTFFLLKEEQRTPLKCFNQFIHYKKDNEVLFTKITKNKILEIAYKITSEVNKRNKSELILLFKLQEEFE